MRKNRLMSMSVSCCIRSCCVKGHASAETTYCDSCVCYWIKISSNDELGSDGWVKITTNGICVDLCSY